jgi:nitrate/nitrite transporter NarK
MCFMVISVIPAQYFRAKRGLANGLVFAGGGFGGAAISVSLDALIQKLGTAWAYRILGFTTLATGIPAAWLIRERNRAMRTPGFIEW